MESVTIIGPGRVGGALAIALGRAGYRIDNLVFRNRASASFIAEVIDPPPCLTPYDEPEQVTSNIVIITTADAMIAEAGRTISPYISQQSIVLHTSGALSSDVLSAVRANGPTVGSMHPLVAISDAFAGAEAFFGAYFCIEGDKPAVDTAASIAVRLGGKPFTVETSSKPIYHAGAVMAAGHLVALVDMSIGLLVASGLERQTARDVLLPLIESTVRNLQTQDTFNALTGPFARADLSTVERHLVALDREGLDNEKAVYLELGLRAAELAEENGVGKAGLDAIRKCIMMAKRPAK